MDDDAAAEDAAALDAASLTAVELPAGVATTLDTDGGKEWPDFEVQAVARRARAATAPMRLYEAVMAPVCPDFVRAPLGPQSDGGLRAGRDLGEPAVLHHHLSGRDQPCPCHRIGQYQSHAEPVAAPAFEIGGAHRRPG